MFVCAVSRVYYRNVEMLRHVVRRARGRVQRRQLFQRVPLDFLERLALIEKKAEFVRRERFEGEQIAEAVRQCPFSQHKRGNSKMKSKSTPLDPPARRALPCRFRLAGPR